MFSGKDIGAFIVAAILILAPLAVGAWRGHRQASGPPNPAASQGSPPAPKAQ